MSILNDLKKGVLYNSIGKYSNLLISFILQILLARLLSPDEFGIVAIINVFLVFFQLLSDFGIGPGIIQNKRLTDDDIVNIYSFTVYFSIFLSLIFALLGYPVSYFYNNSEFIKLFPCMSIVLLFGSLYIVPYNVALKAKKFRIVNMIQVFGSLANGIVSVTSAYFGLSYYSLILGHIARAFSQWLLYQFFQKISFQKKFKLISLKKIYYFSRNQLFYDITNYFSRNLDSLLIGRYMPAQELGYYNKAYQLSLYPNTIFTSIITSTIQPIFSYFESQTETLYKGYIFLIRNLANFGIPLSIFLFFSSSDIILFLFGDQWVNSISVFQILSLSVWIQMLLSSTGGFFQSADRTDLLLLSGILSTIVNVIGIVIGVYLGSIDYVAIALLITFSINFFQVNYLMFKVLFNKSLIEFFMVLRKPFVIGVLTSISFFIMPSMDIPIFFSLLFKGFIFLICIVVGMVLTGQLKDLILLMK